MKKALIGVGVVIVLILIVIIALPLFFNANQFKPKLESNLTSALGRQVQIGNLSLSIISGGVTVDNVSVSDDPAFSKSPFLQAKQLTIGVELLPLIFSKKIEVRSFTIDSPEVTLLKTASGKWNYSSFGSGIAKTAQITPEITDVSEAALFTFADAPSSTDFNVQKLTISNGKIFVGQVGSRQKPVEYDNVNLTSSDLSYTTQFPISLTATGPGNAAIKVDGKAGPINRQDMSASPLDAKVDVQHLDLASTGFVDPSAGIAGLLDFNGNLTSNGQTASSQGTVKATKLKASPHGSPSSVPVTVDYNTDYDLKRDTGVLKQGDIHIGKALARLTGNYNMSGETTSIQMKLNGQGMPVPDLEGALPAVGVALPTGASLKSGTMDLNLALSGPVDKLVIEGPVKISDAKLSGFSMGSKLSALQAFTGHTGGGSDTEIQTLSTNLRVDPSGTQAQNLNLVVPSIGSMTGGGTVSPAGQLDFKMVAQLAGIGGALSGVSSGLGILGGGSSSGGKQSSGIPFMIRGTTSDPIFIPDTSAIAKSAITGGLGNALGNSKGGTAGAAAGALGGLLGRRRN
ncbi:MAG TPA: AsmA family protein [Candidatus Micrarchaeaceae archaeon]|nr:AsmA family protein [Candidatus Micrarchaeaceae archaeon]